MAQQTYNWKRFWCPIGSAINLTEDGYLIDPTTEWGHRANPTAFLFEDIEDIPCLVLLGEPGMGKSREIKDYQEILNNRIQGDASLLLDLRAYQSEAGLQHALNTNPLVDSWLRGSHKLHLFIDSLDEGLLRITTVTALLTEIFRTWEVSRLFLRIACRTAEWRESFEMDLKYLWQETNVRVVELVQLRHIDVAEAATQNKVDAEAFLKEVSRVKASPLAAKPITLDFLLSKFRKSGGLPSDQTELYAEGCRLLCEETNMGRRDARMSRALTTEQRLAVASQIAAVTIFANRYAIWTDIDRGDVPPEDIAIERLYGGRLGDLKITEREITDTLNTGLFSSRGSHRLGWVHQTYAEYLAARFLMEHHVPRMK